MEAQLDAARAVGARGRGRRPDPGRASDGPARGTVARRGRDGAHRPPAGGQTVTGARCSRSRSNGCCSRTDRAEPSCRSRRSGRCPTCRSPPSRPTAASSRAASRSGHALRALARDRVVVRVVDRRRRGRRPARPCRRRPHRRHRPSTGGRPAARARADGPCWTVPDRGDPGRAGGLTFGTPDRRPGPGAGRAPRPRPGRAQCSPSPSWPVSAGESSSAGSRAPAAHGSRRTCAGCTPRARLASTRHWRRPPIWMAGSSPDRTRA